MRKVPRSALTFAIASVVALGCTASTPAPTSSPSDAAAGNSSSGAIAPSAGRTFFVATTGDDSSPGTEARPFRTVQAAQLALRSLLAQDPRTNVRVAIASGSYPLPATLILDQRDSPADGFTVRYTGPADASAVLTGGRTITGWERVSGETHRAKLPQGLSFTTLFENDQRATLARTPNEGYIRAKGAVGPKGSATQFVYGAGDLPDGLDPTTASVYIWSGCDMAGVVSWDWEVDIAGVNAIDPATRTITLAQPAWFPICAGNRYFVQGPRSLIDRPGEFAIDQGYVYYWPRTTPIEAQKMVAPALARLVEVKGASESALAKNIVLERLTFTQTDFPRTARAGTPGLDHAAVHVENAENVAVRASRFTDLGGTGVHLRGHAQRVVVDGNLIERVGVHGVWIRGLFTSQPRVSKENRVTNNRIRMGGRLHGSGSGVKLENTAANEIANNEISDMPRYGISLKGTTLPQLQQFEPQVGATEKDLNDVRHARENVIRRNEVFRVMTDSQDGAGIEMWGAGPGNRIEENRVHDIDTGDRREGFTGATAARGPLLYGIYTDDGSDLAVVRGNVVYGIRGPNAGAAMIKGIGSEVTANVFVCDGGGGGIESSLNGNVPVESLRITRNILVRPSGSDVYWWRSFSDKTVAEADRNLFYGTAGSYTVRFRFGSDVLTLDQWRARYGFDRASVMADPLFVDAARADYRVRDGSPALALGFANVDPALIGLRPDFPFGR